MDLALTVVEASVTDSVPAHSGGVSLNALTPPWLAASPHNGCKLSTASQLQPLTKFPLLCSALSTSDFNLDFQHYAVAVVQGIVNRPRRDYCLVYLLAVLERNIRTSGSR